jgi:NDP-sugar pyrophosphorylase family protein
VLEPQVLHEVPGEGVFHMTDLFRHLLEAGRETTVFPIHAYWMDIGHHDDFKRANGEYDGVFR